MDPKQNLTKWPIQMHLIAGQITSEQFEVINIHNSFTNYSSRNFFKSTYMIVCREKCLLTSYIKSMQINLASTKACKIQILNYSK